MVIIVNDPVLFIDSVNDKKEGKENQEHYDSRNSKKKRLAKYRLEDIEAMLYYRIHVLAVVYTREQTFEGIVEEVSERGIVLQTENKKITIPIIEIEDINILKL